MNVSFIYIISFPAQAA